MKILPVRPEGEFLGSALANGLKAGNNVFANQFTLLIKSEKILPGRK